MADAGAEGEGLRVAGARTGEFLVARVLKAHWPVGGDCEVRAQIFNQHFLLAAKAAANPWLDDANALDRQFQQRRHHAAHMKWHLRARANYQPVFIVPPRDYDVRFDVALVDLVRAVGALEALVGSSQRGFNIANARVDFRREVAVAIGDGYRIRLIVNDRCARLHGRMWIKNGGQFLVFHLYQKQCGARNCGRFRCDNCYAVAHVTHFAVQRNLVVRRRIGMRLAARRINDAGHIGIRKHCVDAG